MSRSTAEYSQQLLDLMGAESSQYAKAPSYETSAYAKAPSYENSAYAKAPSYENSVYAKAPSYDVNRTYTDDLQVFLVTKILYNSKCLFVCSVFVCLSV